MANSPGRLRLQAETLQAAGEAVRGWFRENGLPFFFREERTPYVVWILEIMGQQTQLSRAMAYLERWLLRFPDILTLASADEADVLRAWEGLGYYSRARNLHKAARLLVAEHGGVFPDRYETILTLPGVGEYTAAAIASIVFHERVPAVDANILRVCARLVCYEGGLSEKVWRETVRELVVSLFGSGDPGETNEGLMELGERVCRRRNPLCSVCPLASICRARAAGAENRIPLLSARPEPVRQSWAVALVVDASGRLYALPPGEGGLWPGLWSLPKVLLGDKAPQPDEVGQLFDGVVPFPVSVKEVLAPVRHSYTRYRLLFYPVLATVLKGGGEGWFCPREFEALPFPSGMRKVLTALNEA